MLVFQDLPNTTTPINAQNLNSNFEECNNIIESGSNANGKYVKYSDGTMICYKTLTGTTDITTAWGSLYTSADVNLGNFASYFLARPTIIISPQAQTGTQYMLSTQSGSSSGSSSSAGSITLIRPNSRTGVAYILDVVAIGKWK